MVMKKRLSLFIIFIQFFFLLKIGASEEVQMNSSDIGGEKVRVLLLPGEETVLSGEISARVIKLSVDFGDSFKKGQNLISLDCEMHNAQLKKAEAELEEAEKIYEVNKHLEELASISEIDLAVSKSKKIKASAELNLRRDMADNCSIKAPFSGRVVSIKVNEYEYITPGQPLIEIVGSRDFELQMFVKSSWLQWLKKGQIFNVYIDETKKEYKASIMSIGARVDPVSQTIEIRGKMDMPHHELLSGMSGTAYFDR